MNTTAVSSPRVFLSPLPARHTPLLAELDRWVAQGWLRALDRSFAAFLSQQAPDADPLLILGAALASHQLGRGHACLDLRAALADAVQALSMPPEGVARDTPEGMPTPTPPSTLLAGVTLAKWNKALRHPALVAAGPGATPLVHAGDRLYLRRYWQYEISVSEAIARRVAMPTPSAAPEAQAGLAAALDALFERRDGAATDWQKIACAIAVKQSFSIITGGPGTGKTTTVVRLLAVLLHLALSTDDGTARRLRIRLAAPTGKAAARLNESIAGAVARLPLDGLPDAEALRASIPTEVTTVHRLLGSRPDTRHFRHNARNPLPLDLLVLDEASMLDLEMMASVFAALPPHARLILLGDKDQLASVEAGAVLGDLCARADAGHYSVDTAAWLQAVTGEFFDPELCDAKGTPLDQAVVKLRVSHRFSAQSGIGQLAEAVNAGNDFAVQRTFDKPYPDVSRQWPVDDATLRRLVVDGAPEGFAGQGRGRVEHGNRQVAPPVGYRHYLTLMRERQPKIDAPQPDFDAWAQEVLTAYGQFQLLCALRSGPQGVEGLNLRIAALLRAEGLLEGEHGGWYPGRPVLVTRNDYGLGLMNGDVGVTLSLPTTLPSDPHPRWTLRVAFATGDGKGGIHWVLPSRLRSVETVFAMTVHKSQGSEFTHTALLLPERPSPIVTRELVYTGITRARHWFTLAAAPEVLRTAIARRVDRVGGLAARLGGLRAVET
ncbi:exodeoxyribonuclease V subunit alpha [Variovorax humicola]|uniref:RecBCD enzyme subunit RecD n=1 Tax=Variovorax humicola TaxID=1769758 RepID=A0ABU8W2M7_9BURK